MFPDIIDPSLYAKLSPAMFDNAVKTSGEKMKPCAYTSKIYGPEHPTKEFYRLDVRKHLLPLVDVKRDYISIFAGMPVVSGAVRHSFVVCQGPDWHHGSQATQPLEQRPTDI